MIRLLFYAATTSSQTPPPSSIYRPTSRNMSALRYHFLVVLVSVMIATHTACHMLVFDNIAPPEANFSEHKQHSYFHS